MLVNALFVLSYFAPITWTKLKLLSNITGSLLSCLTIAVIQFDLELLVKLQLTSQHWNFLIALEAKRNASLMSVQLLWEIVWNWYLCINKSRNWLIGREPTKETLSDSDCKSVFLNLFRQCDLLREKFLPIYLKTDFFLQLFYN